MSTVSVLLERWVGALPALALRTEPHPSREGWLAVEVGTRDYQAIDLALDVPGEQGEVSDSQSTERVADGRARHTIPWDDGWTERDLPSFEAWVEGALTRVILGHLRWSVEGVHEEHDGGAALRQLCRELREIEALKAISLPEQLQPYLELAQPLLAADADEEAVHTLAALATTHGRGLDDASSVFSMVVGAGASSLPAEAQTVLASLLSETLDAEVRRVAGAAQERPRDFHQLKKVLDRSPPPLQRLMAAVLSEMRVSHTSANEEDRALQALITRYDELSRDWHTYSPSCADPAQEGRDFLALEAEINAAWRARLNGVSDPARSALTQRLVADGRFLSGATALVLGWLRIQGEYRQAVELFHTQAPDIEMLVLRHRSQTAAFENMLNNALGAFLDSGDAAHIPQAMAIVDALEARVTWETGYCDYQLACVFSRAGLVERAIAAIQRCVARGRSVPGMLSDPDLAAVLDHPTFQRLLAES